MKNVFITGANRGIGLGFVKHYLSLGYEVIASCRQPQTAEELDTLKQKFNSHLTIEQLDITNPDHLTTIGNKYSSNHIDILINNSGIYPSSNHNAPLEKVSNKDFLDGFQVNVLGTISVTKILKNSLLKSDKPIVINISSLMGSITETSNPGSYSYRISKAALNMFTKCFSLETKKIITVSFHPGWVKTDMGGSGASIDVQESVQCMSQLISQLNYSHSGKFLDYRGEEIAW